MDLRSFSQTLTQRAKTIDDRRALFREEVLPSRYSGVAHVAFTTVLTAGLALLALTMIEAWDLTVSMAMAAAVFASMSFIYFAHRYPMHRPLPGAGAIYDLHTRVHHMLFGEGRTEIRVHQDVYMVMLPVWMAAALCVVGFPLVAAPLLWVGTDAALAFLAVVYLYFGGYELVHLATHAPAESRLHRVPVLSALIRHHQEHHAWDKMHKGNFSMIIPLWDWVLGTKL